MGEFEPDGSPKKYPLQQPIYDHGYNWETWKLMPVGMFHTVYIGEFARDLPPHWAFLGSIPPWAGIPVAVMFGILFANMIQNLGSIGIRPKRFTPEWQGMMKERERAENKPGDAVLGSSPCRARHEPDDVGLLPHSSVLHLDEEQPRLGRSGRPGKA